jgi:hypothetical protein
VIQAHDDPDPLARVAHALLQIKQINRYNVELPAIR